MDIKEKVIEIVVEQLNVTDKDSVTMDSKIVEDLGADSLDIVELVMALEETFSIEVSDDESKELITVGNVVAFIEKRQG